MIQKESSEAEGTYNRMIHAESHAEKQLQDQQQGFRRGRGTADGIFILKQIQQIRHQLNKQTYTLFVDLTAAFDHVDRGWMFQSIYQRLPKETNRKLFELIESLYSHTTTALQQNLTDVFEIGIGVRQGGVESPALFNLYIDYVMRVYLKRCETEKIEFCKVRYAIPSTALTNGSQFTLGKYGCETADWIGYADDLVLFFNDAENHQCGLNLLNETFER